MKIVATFGIKYEPDWLVDGLIRNLKGVVDDFAVIDCRHRTKELWIHEHEYRKLQRQECERLKADFVLVTSPDERWEKNAGPVFRRLCEEKKKVIYRFPLREMFTPTKYRIDGIWGLKRRPRLYPLLPGQRYPKRRIQGSPTPIAADGYRIEDVPQVNLYHLKMIEPENRYMRADVYDALDPGNKIYRKNTPKLQKLDPEGRYNEMGYYYLADDEGMVLESIPRSRGFYPHYDRPYLFEVPAEMIEKERARNIGRQV